MISAVDNLGVECGQPGEWQELLYRVNDNGHAREHATKKSSEVGPAGQRKNAR